MRIYAGGIMTVLKSGTVILKATAVKASSLPAAKRKAFAHAKSQEDYDEELVQSIDVEFVAIPNGWLEKENTK